MPYFFAPKTGENEVDDEGAGELAVALAKNPSLTAVDVRWNRIGADGRFQIARALQMRPPPEPKLMKLYPTLKLISGLNLRRAAMQLKLPANAVRWSNEVILRFMWRQQERSLAFWMLTNVRLGCNKPGF